MSASRLYLGIDTSCYTTSVAAVIDDKIINIKKPLTVKEGNCGLRQSDAVFQHIKNLPECFMQLKNSIDMSNISGITITASSRPRNVDGSYMPVFLAGQAFARSIAAVADAEYFETSHQEGHIMAAIHSSDKYSLLNQPFLTYHLSGGTTELLLVTPNGKGFSCEIVGGTKDLPAGQFIDRIGLKMGMPFPSGKQLDEAAVSFEGEVGKVKTCVNEAYINFSGEETRYSKMLRSGSENGFVAACVMKCISRSVQKSIEFAANKYKPQNTLLVGGVSSSQYIRREFKGTPNVYFAEPGLATDNAVGVCLMGKLMKA